MTDVQALKARINIVDVIGQTVQLRRSGSSYLGFCPFHDNHHTPALAVFPQTGTWKCFGACNAGGDVFAWVMKRDGLDFKEALKALDDGVPASPLPLPERPPDPLPAPPNKKWQARAREFVMQCQDKLWDTATAMNYLRGPERGLNDHTIGWAGLGLNTESRREAPEMWGLPQDAGWVYLPQGLTIPAFVGDDIWYVKVRLPRGRPQGPKYLNIKRDNAAPVLYLADQCKARRVVAFTEGEFDALKLWQECKDIVGVGTLGAQGYRLDTYWMRYLLDAEVILAAYDTDGKSEKGAEALMSLTDKIRRVTVPQGKDVCEAAKAGVNLFRWLLAERRAALAALFADTAAHIYYLQEQACRPNPPLLAADYASDLAELSQPEAA